MPGHPPLAAVACLPERLGELLCCRRFGGAELVDTGAEAERFGLPEPVEAYASFDAEIGDVPAAVADRVGERCPDRPVWQVDRSTRRRFRDRARLWSVSARSWSGRVA
jgi:hypothetical protein